MKFGGVFELHWGDSAKAKVVLFLLREVLRPRIKMCARFNGSDNAGNTGKENGVEFVAHNLPISVICNHVDSFIAPMCLVSLPRIFSNEMPELAVKGVKFDRLRIAKETFTVLPWHREIEQLEEAALGATKRDGTARGIGPAYGDLTRKYAISVGDLLDESALRIKVRENIAVKNLIDSFRTRNYDENHVVEQLLSYGKLLEPYMVETDLYLCKLDDDCMPDDLALLVQAQGAMLDINSPSYPYVSSSGMTVHDASKAFRLRNEDFAFRLGVCKAYTTSVGRRDFPTKLTDETGQGLQNRGAEFGRTSGRLRDCGWLDGPALRHGILVNQITSLFVTKLDVLDQEPEIRFCISYKREDRFEVEIAPRLGLGDCKPVYKTFKGWQKPTAGMRKLGDLPKKAREYIDFIEIYSGKPVVGISTGPDTYDTIWCYRQTM